MTPSAPIRYADMQESLRVRLICEWHRGFMPGPVMSNSSGPKDYFKNQIWSALEADRIVMVRGSGPPFLLSQNENGVWFDATGKEVVGMDELLAKQEART